MMMTTIIMIWKAASLTGEMRPLLRLQSQDSIEARKDLLPIGMSKVPCTDIVSAIGIAKDWVLTSRVGKNL